MTEPGWVVSVTAGRFFGCYGQCCEFWTKGVCIGIFCVSLPVVLGFLRNDDEDGVERDKLDYRVVWPGVGLFAFQVIAASQVSMGVAADMIQERSAGMDMREAMRTNMTNTAIVAALFLTIVIAMLQADPPFDGGDESPYRFLSQWYMVLLLISTVYCLNAAIMCSLCLMYLEPLNTSAALVFLKDNLLYFGEPLTQTAFAVFNLVGALLIWIFGRYGNRIGALSSAVVAYVVLRIMVVYLNLRAWKNPLLDEKDREIRNAEYAALAGSSSAAQTSKIAISES